MNLVEALNIEGISVQLEHVEAETSWEAHGFVSIHGKGGVELCRDDAFQHNRNYRQMKTRAASMAEKVKVMLEDQAEEEAAETTASAAALPVTNLARSDSAEAA